MVINPNTGETSYIHKTPHRIRFITFFPITNEFACGIGSSELALLSVPAWSWRKFDHPSGMTSVSMSSNGTMVAKTIESSIQLLKLEEGYSSLRQPITSVLSFRTLDEGNIIAIRLSGHDDDHIALLETATMSKIQAIPTPDQGSIFLVNYSKILCASLKHRIVVHCFGVGFTMHLQLWRFDNKAPLWMDTMEAGRMVGGISPNGSWLLAINGYGPSSLVQMWDTGNGTRVAEIPVGLPWPTDPLQIKFESEDKFYSNHDTFRVPFTISGLSIIRHEQVPPAKQPQRHYDLDGSCEWIVRSSKRVFWVPPEYIGPNCWVGNMLITVGQDGVLRKLTFREPS
jgi:hypothetical protein